MWRLKDLRTADGRPALHVARMNGISEVALRHRLRLGWGLERAVTQKPKR